MWYEIYIDNGNGLERIYYPGDSDLTLQDIHYKPVAGSAGTLEFSIARNHPFYDAIRPLSTDFWVYNDGVPEWRGRYVGSEVDYQRTGALTIEGDLNFLIDSLQDPYDFEGTASQFLQTIVANHNGMVEARKQFTLGVCSAVAPSGMHLEATDYITSLDALNELVELCGGFLTVRHENGNNYLDIVSDLGTNSQFIKFGDNLIDFNKSVDASTIVTCLIPLGAEVEDSEGNSTRVDITSVNGGVKYISHSAGVANYGQIWGTITFDEIENPSVLLATARQYLNESVALPQTLSLTAVDLSLLDANFEKFKVGCWTRIECPQYGVSATYLLTEADICIDAPETSVITLGGTLESLTAATAKEMKEVSRSVSEFATKASKELLDKIQNATELITGATGGYVVINQDTQSGEPQEILVMDAPTKGAARNVIRINRNGIGFSRNGYNGPFSNAWTIDGNLVADYITSGTMSADRVRGGALEIGGTGYGRDGSISVKDASGNVIGTWNKNGITITRGNIRVGRLRADNTTATIGCFTAYTSPRSGAEYLALDDQSVGLGDHENFAFWAGSSGENPPFMVTQTGVVRVKELYPQDSWWDGWSLTDTMEDVYSRLRALERAGESSSITFLGGGTGTVPDGYISYIRAQGERIEIVPCEVEVHGPIETRIVNGELIGDMNFPMAEAEYTIQYTDNTSALKTATLVQGSNINVIKIKPAAGKTMSKITVVVREI